MFEKTQKQIEACHILNTHKHALLVGGGRSGKTTIAVRNIIIRALKVESRHLIARLHFNSVKKAIGLETFPKVSKGFFPAIKHKFKVNKADWYIEIPAACGGTSVIWLGGIDDKDRLEKLLGFEYSTIYVNESSEVTYDAVTTLRTRLAENSGLKLKFYYDLNPTTKRHWTYREFIEKVSPLEDRLPHKLDVGHIFVNPIDNQENLADDYIEELENLPKKKKNRFLKGIYQSDTDGALWTDDMIDYALGKAYETPIQTVIAVDPAVTHNENSDETGIVVCSIDEFKTGIVEEDLTGKFSTKTWAQRVINAYHKYEASYIVAETNQGGDLVVDAIKNIDPNIPVKQVKASKGKFARAEPVSELYELGRIAHTKILPKLEEEMTEWIPFNTRESPNRIDALVWGMFFLIIAPEERLRRVMQTNGN